MNKQSVCAGHIGVNYITPLAESSPLIKSEDDTCYIITLTERTDARTEDSVGECQDFHTGIKFTSFPPGYHAELFAKSDLENQGYSMLSHRIISSNDTDEIIISLFKFKEGDDLELPFPAVNILIRKTEFVRFESIKNRGQPRISSISLAPSKYEEEEKHHRKPTKKGSNMY